MNTLIYHPTTNQVAAALLNSGSYLIKDTPSLLNPNTWFRWKSGIVAPVYTNCRYLMGSPTETAIIVNSLISSIKVTFPEVEFIVGVESAGIHWSSIVAFNMGLPTSFVRKQVKAHGADEGRFVGASQNLKNVSAIIVDDLVASGESLEEVIGVLRDEKQMNVIGIQSIVNWNFSRMRDRFTKLNLPIKALVSYPHILEEAERQNIISGRIKEELRLFYQNPQAHVLNFDFLSK